MSSATALAWETIRKGGREIARGEAPTGTTAALEAVVDPLTRGDPTSPLPWTCKSRAKLTAALTEQGWRVSSTTVGRLLHCLGYRAAVGAQTAGRRYAPGTANWRGTPLTTFETIVDRIAGARGRRLELRVRAELETKEYPTGGTVTKSQMDTALLVSRGMELHAGTSTKLTNQYRSLSLRSEEAAANVDARNCANSTRH